eukprot:1928137-Rhodomonas_salina.1
MRYAFVQRRTSTTRGTTRHRLSTDEYQLGYHATPTGSRAVPEKTPLRPPGSENRRRSTAESATAYLCNKAYAICLADIYQKEYAHLVGTRREGRRESDGVYEVDPERVPPSPGSSISELSKKHGVGSYQEPVPSPAEVPDIPYQTRSTISAFPRPVPDIAPHHSQGQYQTSRRRVPYRPACCTSMSAFRCHPGSTPRCISTGHRLGCG